MGKNSLAIGLGVGLGVSLGVPLVICALMCFLFRHRRRAQPLGEKAVTGDDSWTAANHGIGTDAEKQNKLSAERQNGLSTEEEYKELDVEGYQPGLPSYEESGCRLVLPTN
ncbi:hypothetical protein MMC34_004524 [Xylographa carneopallida]|nr:hypothetical protein [Xylographa carneopallida]